MDNIRGYIRARKFHGYGYGYAKFSWILSMESPKGERALKQVERSKGLFIDKKIEIASAKSGLTLEN